MRYYITDSQLLRREHTYNIRYQGKMSYHIYLLTLLAKDTVPEKHVKIRTLFVTANLSMDIYDTESIRIDKYYKGLLDEDISIFKYCDRKVQGTIMLEKDDGIPNPNTYLKQNYYGPLSDEDIMELILQNT